MRFLTQICSRLRALFRRSAVERDMAEETRTHLEMQEERNRAAGTGFNGGLGIIDARALD
jgi:hypothetical protein